MPSRRELLRRLAFGVVPFVMQGQVPAAVVRQKDAADPLADPGMTGRAVAPLSRWDNDPGIIALERKLRCECGCTLDVYTCRTTDFTCTYSPAMHRTIVEQIRAGQTPEQVIAGFVARDGEQVLMAPVPEGFNLAGYLVPGLVVVSVGLALMAWLTRRRQQVAPVAAAPATPAVADDPDALARLQRALDEVDS